MSSEAADGLPGQEVVEAVHDELTDPSNDRLVEELEGAILRQVDERCKRQINAGRYDATASLSELFAWFRREHLQSDSALVQDVLTADSLSARLSEHGRDRIGRIVFEQLVESLERSEELLYVYDRQRVRSHVAEMARYFALIRQRIDEDTDFEFAPNLVKMVKMDVIDREQPILEGDGAANFNETLRSVLKRVSGESPAHEFETTLGASWSDAVKDTASVFQEFFVEGLPEEFDSLAAYQKRAIVELYGHAMTEGELDEDLAHVITAGTGGGKTEAFLFPVLMYCHTAWKAGLTGNRAILTYPRRDLCDNQFDRLFGYVYELNSILDRAEASFEEAPISVSIQHGGRRNVSLSCPACGGELTPPETEEGGHEDGPFSCPDGHRYEWATTQRDAAATIVVTTQNSLHLRMMDRHGRTAFWEQDHPTKFLVLDEVHVYSEQAGMHVSNVTRRFKRGVRELSPAQRPSLVASSATLHEAEDFTKRIFGADEATRIHPKPDEKDTIGSEYMIFVKATEPRDVAIPIGDSVFRPQDSWDDVERTTASNLSCMIQIAFAFWHTARKERGGLESNRSDKDRILGFVDSIDSVSRLGSSIEDAEQERTLFSLRQPDAFLQGERKNPDCPTERFREGTDDAYEEEAVCETLPPNKHLNVCPVYEAGECWWTMRDIFELKPMRMAIHKSGKRQRPSSPKHPGDEWDQMIATSALEVGFDDSRIIGTFQYRAPMSVPGFLQRKGRGGRDADDRPVTVVVLGSTSTDSYYFHHSDYLSDPRNEHRKIPLDETNRFVRTEHMVAAIFDYFNLNPAVDAQRLYEGDWNRGETGPQVPELQHELEKRREDLGNWLETAFDADSTETDRVLEAMTDYVDSLTEPVAPGIDDTPFWKLFREAVDEAGTSGSYGKLDDLTERLRGEVE